MTIRALAIEILARTPGRYVPGPEICRLLMEENPDLARTYRTGSFNATVARCLRKEAKYGTIEYARRQGFTEWRLVA